MRHKADAAALISPAQGDAPAAAEIGQLVALFNAGRYVELESRACLLVGRYPDSGIAWKILGTALQVQGKEGLPALQKAAELLPDDTEAHINLGNALQDLGQLDDAAASYRRALEIKPDYAEALDNLAVLSIAQCQPMMALNVIKQSLQIKATAEAKSNFVACVKHLRCTHDDSDIRVTLVRALTEPWGRPAYLARAGIDLVKLNPEIGECVARATNAWPLRLSAQDLFGLNGLTTLASEPLLCALLNTAPICDIEMERFLTLARSAMLEAATRMTAADGKVGTALNFYSALARQCFINEYVFMHTDDEIQEAGDLRDSLAAALEAKTQVPVLWPIAVAAYFPLCSLPFANQFLDKQWPAEVAAVLLQQIHEPQEEPQLRATIPRLTDIDDEVSLRVQIQYEESPYPRWTRTTPAGKARNVTG